ncbi:MAG: hypothetical protein MUF37_08200, partial [Methanoregulaceae archaeon]|nr:hypothetical protein [Methanoregulaceae archaeon]
MIPTVRIPGMRRLVIFIIVLTALSGYAIAHPPADVAVSYDQSSSDLIVIITHQVDDPSTHYVKQVTVRQGTTVLADQSYTSQPDKSASTYRYNLPQLKGTGGEVRVEVECNILGSRSGTLTLTATPVPGTPGSQTPAPTRAPGCVLVVLAAVGLVAMRIM